MKDEGEDLLEHLTKKYGPSAKSNFGDPNSRLMTMGRDVGINFKTDRKIYNTVKAHALLEHVKSKDNDKANEMMEDLYKRYFERGEDISNGDNLVEVAKGILPEKEAREVMASTEKRGEVLEQDRMQKGMGVHGVPYFIIESKKDPNRPVTFSGAYPPSHIARELRKAVKE